MSGMAVPEWTGDLKQKFYEMAKDMPAQQQLEQVEFHKILDFSTHFAEWRTRKDDIIIHFFPRDGKTDRWEDGHYIPKCRECKREVPVEMLSTKKAVACPHCGHAGLVYVPGRQENKISISALNGTEEMLKKAIDAAWMGDAAVEFIPELGAYAVQLRNAKNTLEVVGEKFVDKISEEYDHLLETEEKPSGE
jgi:DNA-directed RNA polymerase subunit RPC12/RpoP